MTSGKEIRARIDSEQVRGLLLINGGAAVALIALIPFVFDNQDLLTLARDSSGICGATQQAPKKMLAGIRDCRNKFPRLARTLHYFWVAS